MSRRLGLVLVALGGLARSASSQPSGEAYLAAAVSRHAAAIGDGTLGGFTLGFAIGSPTLTVGPELLVQNGDSLRVRAFAIAARLRQGGRWIHPHLMVGLGAYSWQRRDPDRAVDTPLAARWLEVSYFSGALGGGATIGPWRGRITGLVEARWHRNLEQNRREGSRSLVGIEAGLRLWW